MDSLNKLYESNYFGIGLFAVISFLVTTFLVVLFFGKRDEQKRKLQERKINVHKIQDTFNEVTKNTPVEVQTPVVNNIPTQPINLEPAIQAPVPRPVEMVPPVVETTPVMPNITEVQNTPIMMSEPRTDLPSPTVIEPVKINIPEPTKEVSIEPVLNLESVPKENTKPVIEEPVITGAYYTPGGSDNKEEVKVPSIDFEAIAKSISEELEELEKSTKDLPRTRNNIEDTPQFSSVYVREPLKNKPNEIDLPIKRDEY